MKKRTRLGKIAYVLPLATLITMLCSVGVMAYLQWNSSLNNEFNAETSADPTIKETFDSVTKSDVSVLVGDTDYSVYVRAVVLVNWTNEDGEVLGENPESADYSISYNLSDDGWFDGGDGYYYYSLPVVSEGITADLIESCQPLVAAPEDGYTLNVEIIAQTIQSVGTTNSGDIPAVTQAWGVAVGEGGKLVKS